jgi:hypothetical protein
MTQSQQYELRVLTELIVTTLDRAQSYREAALRADAALAATFVQRACEHFQAVEQLRKQARALRGKPANTASIFGAARSATTRQQCVDDGSTQLCFEKALRDIRISDLVRSVIYAARARIDDDLCPQTTAAL